jgi:hypothetical protein
VHRFICFQIGLNTIGSILVGPFDRRGDAIVEANVAHDFVVQIFDGSKDAAGNEVSLNFGEQISIWLSQDE